MKKLLLVYIVILAATCGAIGQYLDKHLVNMGITRNDYFYYMCFSMIPFSIIMLIIEYFNSYWSIPRNKIVERFIRKSTWIYNQINKEDDKYIYKSI